MLRRRTAPAPGPGDAADPITIRDLRRDEGELLDGLMSALSPHSRYLRFHTPISTLTAGMRRALLDVDGRDRIALVAEADDGTPIGIARTIRDPRRRDEAEIAFAVIDDLHRRGVGRQLVTAVAARAEAEGVRRLVAYVLPENAAALGLVRSAFPVCLTQYDDDSVVMVAMLGAAAADWTITMDDIVAA
jgi:GNAT superfamily N-acetyltransferase